MLAKLANIYVGLSAVYLVGGQSILTYTQFCAQFNFVEDRTQNKSFSGFIELLGWMENLSNTYYKTTDKVSLLERIRRFDIWLLNSQWEV